uniref:Pseudouridylate synthase RPUSD4, mitochondrial n=1 Tax=Phallusia mammillata TaxID=59560 RepID=A0A6F9DRH7_9ASCI|nr:RNA pseudouridylate synthase domain-containing protein 4 [Phallusia mammillata]
MDIAKELRQKKLNSDEPEKDTEENLVKKAVNAIKMTDFTYVEDEAIAKLIRRHVIYADNKMVIFNKPYGLSVHDGDGISKNVKQVLPMLSKMIYGVSTDVPLSLCHRLDKNTTGVLVCTADPALESHVKKMFRLNLVTRKMWAILVGIPHPQMGIVNIPIGQAQTTDKLTSKQFTRMVARPTVSYDKMTGEETARSFSRGQTAITKFRVMDSSRDVSLVEFEPETGVKHQIRLHAADCLDCPILGDHKYSKMDSLAPQKVPINILNRFKLPPTKTRYIPMHLHQSQILIPDVFDHPEKRHLVVGARMPVHMDRALRLFRLNPGKPSQWKVKAIPPPQLEAPPSDPSNPLFRNPQAETDFSNVKPVDPVDQCVFVFRSQLHVKYKKY